MKNTIVKKMLAVTIFSICLLSFSSCASKDEKDTTASSDVIKAPQLFESFTTEDLAGNSVDSSIFSENKVTMINVWNSGCSPCIEELPILEQLSQDYEGKEVGIKGLIFEMKAGLSDEERSTVEDILNKAGAQYQQLLVSESMLHSDAIQNIMAFPTTFFVDSNGKILYSTEGAREYDDWVDAIDKALKLVDKNA